MRSAAKLHTESRHSHDAYNVSVLLAEKRHRAFRLCLVLLHLGNLNVLRLQNNVVDKFFNIRKLLRRYRLEIREIETKPLRCDQRSRLIDLIANNALQSCLQKMGRRMIARRGQLLFTIQRNLHGIADLEHTFFHIADMVNRAVRQFLCV